MATNTAVSYPFDPEGNAATNLIIGELAVLELPNYMDFFFIIPKAAPFYANSLEIVKIDEARPLVRGQDYVPSYRFNDASYQCASDIYGAITILKKSMTGGVRLKYQTLGGPWTIDEAKILELLSNALVDPRITTWEQVVEMPERFPPINHDWDVVDMTGMTQVVEAVYDIVAAIQDSAGAELPNHLADFNNPHRVTKDQVQLGNVQNFGIATVPEATGGTVANKYMTPERTRQAIDARLSATLDVHTARQDNPHGTNAAQVGLGLVQNYGIATTPEAQAGTATNKYMTPVLVKSAIDSQVMSVLTPHVQALNNPHQTNKAQVQLGNVENYGIATVAEARAGTATDKYMTPSLVREAIAVQGLAGLDAHIQRQDNPHNVTNVQVGLGSVQNFGLATDNEAKSGTATNKYMTPYLVRLAVEALGGAEFNSHINDTSNPHQTSKIQVGLSLVENYGIATVQEAEAGASTVKYMTPALVKAAIAKLSGVDILTTQLQDHIGQRNPHNTTAADVNAYSKTEIDTQMGNKLGKSEKAADSSKIDGLTLAQLDTRMSSTKIFPAPTNTTDPTWTELCGWPTGDNIATILAPDVVVNVTGGVPAAAGDRPQFRISYSVNSAELRVEQTAGTPANVSFGLVAGANNMLSLYMLSPANREAISLEYHSNPGLTLGTAVVTTVPVGLVYSSRVSYTATRDQDDGARGDLSYGARSANTPDFGPLVEFMNFVDVQQGEAASSANNLPAVLGSDVLNWRPRATFASRLQQTSNAFAHNRVTDNVDSTVAFDANGITTQTLDQLTTRNPMTDYTIEVEMGSVNGNFGNALGVTIAEVQVGRRTFALQVLRSPGQLVVDSKSGTLPGGTGYGLMTIGVNLLQTDATIVKATSGDGLVWGDGVIAANRDLVAQPYNQATSGGWNTPGKVKLRIVRTGNTITVETTNHGQTAYLTGAAKITLDLATDPLLTRFTGAAANWGLLNYCQPQASHKILNRPDKLQPYVLLDKPAGAADASKIYRHSGTAWVESTLNSANPLVRPGRLVYSSWNGRVGAWRRDGSITPMYIEAFTSSNRVALTE